MMGSRGRPPGVPIAVLSAALLGLTPILGKQAILAGLSPIGVVSARTLGAAGVLALIVLIFRRRDLAIYPLGLIGCLIAGGLNGLGSLLYYSALGRIDAGVGQMLFAFHPVFVALVLFLDGHRPPQTTLFRLALSLTAVVLLTQASARGVDWIGVLMMLGAGAFYGLHIPINQRVLYDVPSPTVTLYTLAAMSAVVVPALLLGGGLTPAPDASLLPVFGLTAVTLFSRLALFAGVKSIGGMETALLGLLQLVVALVLSNVVLHESLTALQILGAGLLALALLLPERVPSSLPIGRRRGWLAWLQPVSALSPFADPHEPPTD
ncbi:MAG: DMT family transporter [Anaerolineales bacterium]